MHEERHAIVRRSRAALHGDELKVRDEKRPEQIRRLLPYRALGEVRDQDAPIVHREFEIKSRGNLAEDQAQLRRSVDLPDLVQDRREGLRCEMLSGSLDIPPARSVAFRDPPRCEAADPENCRRCRRAADRSGLRVRERQAPRRRERENAPSRGPHESDQRCLKAETIPAAASARRSGATLVAGLKPTGRSRRSRRGSTRH